MERSSFFNAELVGEEWDRIYLAEDYARYFASFIGNGIFPNPATGLQVIAVDNNMNIKVRQGKGWINGYFYENTDDYILKLDVADGALNRIDRIVLRLDFLTRDIRAKIKKGDYATNAVAKNLQRDADAYEIALADIKVVAGVIKIIQADITDLRLNKNLCGIVHGVVDQVDTTSIFNQFQSWYSQTKTAYDTDIAKWTQEKKQAFDNWYNTNTTAFLKQFNDWYGNNTSKWTNDFNNWFSKIKGQLDGDIAGKLQNQITELDNKIDVLKTEITAEKMVTEHIEGLGVVSLNNIEDGYINIEKIEGNTLVNLLQKFIGTSHDITSKRWILNHGITSNPRVGGLKPNTTYTFINSKNRNMALDLFTGTEWSRAVRGTKIVFTTKGDEIGFNPLCSESDGWISSEDCLNTNYMLLEGDWTNKSIPAYFESIKSLDICTVKSIGANYIDTTKIVGKYRIPPTVENCEVKGGWYFEVYRGILSPGDYSIYYDINKSLNASILTRIIDSVGNPIYTKEIPMDTRLLTFSIDKTQEYRIGLDYQEQRDNSYVLSNLMLFQGNTKPPFQPYKENKIDILNELAGDKALKRLSNEVADVLSSDGIAKRKVGKTIFNGNEDNWRSGFLSDDGKYFITYLVDLVQCRPMAVDILCDRFKVRKDIISDNIIKSYNDEFVGIHAFYKDKALFYISISTAKLTPYGFIEGDTKTYVPAFKAYLKDNPTMVLYELAESVIEKLDIVTSLKCYKGGHIIIDSSIPIPLNIKYPTNFASRVKSTEETVGKVIQNQEELNNRISNIKVPVESVNNKTGAVVLNASDIKTNDGSTVEEKINNVQSQIDSTAKYFNTVTSSLNGRIGDVDNKADDVSKRTTTAQSTADAAKKRADEAFQYANDGKTKITNVVGSPLLATDTFQQQNDKIQSLKNTFASNLTSKKVSANGTENLSNLIDKIKNIQSINIVSGSGNIKKYGTFTLPKLNFIPILILIRERGSTCILTNTDVEIEKYLIDGEARTEPLSLRWLSAANGYEMSATADYVTEIRSEFDSSFFIWIAIGH